jgi:hypothetical protein
MYGPAAMAKDRGASASATPASYPAAVLGHALRIAPTIAPSVRRPALLARQRITTCDYRTCPRVYRISNIAGSEIATIRGSAICTSSSIETSTPNGAL